MFSIKELQMNGLNAVGTWNNVDGANFSGIPREEESLYNKTIIVTTIKV